MAKLSDHEEERKKKPCPSATTARKQFSAPLDPSDPLGFLKEVFEFVAKESNLFKSDSLVNDVNAVVRMVKDKIEAEDKKRKEVSIEANGKAQKKIKEEAAPLPAAEKNGPRAFKQNHMPNVCPNNPYGYYSMYGPGAPYFPGFPPYGYYPCSLYDFPPPGYPTQATNTLKKNITNDTGGTDNVESTPSFEKTSSRPFSPQGLDSINPTSEEDDDDHQVNPPPLKRVAYTTLENELVVKCWMDISIDSIVGDDQKLDQMWIRIGDLYNKNCPADKSKRHWCALKAHFYALLKQTRWFCDCYDKIAKELGSGRSDSDIIDMTQQEYKKRHSKYGFRHIGVWRLLRECPKFANVDGDVHSKKKTKTSESAAYTSMTSNVEDDGDRFHPIGQNLAKGEEKSVETELIEEANPAKDVENETVLSYIDIEEYKILMKDEENVKLEKRAIHKKMLDKIKKKWGV